LGTLTGAAVGKLLPAPETIGLDAVFPAILLALVIPAFKNRTTLIRAVSGAALALAAVPFAPTGLPVLLSLFGLLSRKNNGQYDAVYRRYRHPVAGNLSDASWRREARQSAGIFRALAGAAFRCGDGAAFSVALATTFYEGAHFAGMARVLGVAVAVFLAWRKVPLIGVIIAAAVVTALLRLAGMS
jgi:predicted branched-subunit amino acid permease